MNLPEPFQELMKKKLGVQYPDFVKSLNEPAPTSIRLHPKKALTRVFDQPVPWSEFGKYLTTRPVFTLDPSFHAGAYYVQEASSMFLEQVFEQCIDLLNPLNVLDLCAAPGGKSTHISSLVAEKSLIVSNDVIRSRASILAENLQKWGYPNSIVTNNDPKDFQSLSGFFDVIVIDAPCSGEGMFRKDPEAIKEWSPQHVTLCSSRQKRIVADVWPALKENGILIYCTCTYNDAENEDNLVWLSQQHNIEFLKLKLNKSWQVEEVVKENAIGYRFLPHRVNGEGFFISVMRKKESQQATRIKPKKNFTIPSKKTTETIQSWVKSESEIKFLQHKEWIYYLPADKADEVDFLRQHLKVITSGTTIATEKHEKIIPEHALAMSVNLRKENFKTISVNSEGAIQFLRRDVLTLDEVAKGYYLVLFENIPLGWVNSLGNRFNNMYPLEWRIRMTPT